MVLSRAFSSAPREVLKLKPEFDHGGRRNLRRESWGTVIEVPSNPLELKTTRCWVFPHFRLSFRQTTITGHQHKRQITIGFIAMHTTGSEPPTGCMISEVGRASQGAPPLAKEGLGIIVFIIMGVSNMSRTIHRNGLSWSFIPELRSFIYSHP